jgi:broad specificity phosphatase PhoE
MVLLLARHGQVDPAYAGRWLGRTDVPLSPAGVAEAEDLATWCLTRHADIRRIYSSPRQRAFATACRVAASLQLPVAVAPELDEMDLGRMEGRTVDEMASLDPAGWAHYLADIYEHPLPGGESFRQLEARVLAFARSLPVEDGPVLLVTHTGPLLALIGHALGLDPRARGRLHLETGALSAVRLSPRQLLFLNEKPRLLDRLLEGVGADDRRVAVPGPEQELDVPLGPEEG